MANSAPILGSAYANPADAAKIFRTVCVETRPDFSTAAEILGTLPFEINPATGTFYHKDFSISVKVFEQDGLSVCSLVTIADNVEPETGYLFAAAAFADVPEQDRGKTQVYEDNARKLVAFDPSIGNFQFEMRQDGTKEVIKVTIVTKK